MTNYREIRENIEDIKNPYEVLLDVIEKRDEQSALFILNHFHDNKTWLSEDSRLDVLIRSIKSRFKRIYKLLMEDSFKEHVLEKIKDLKDIKVFKFLVSMEFFNNDLAYKIITTIDNKILFESIENMSYYQYSLNKIYKGIFYRGKYDELLIFINKGCKLGRYCNDLIRKIKDDGIIKELYEKGLFKGDMDHVLYYLIMDQRDDLVNFFIEKGAEIEKIKEDLQTSLMNIIQYDQLDSIEYLLKFELNVDESFNGCNSCIDKFLYESNSVNEERRKIAYLLFQHSSQDKLKENFIKLIKYFELEDIRRIYNDGFSLDVIELNEDYLIEHFTEDKLSLMNELDENLIDFISVNLDLMLKHCNKETVSYIQSII